MARFNYDVEFHTKRKDSRLIKATVFFTVGELYY